MLKAGWIFVLRSDQFIKWSDESSKRIRYRASKTALIWRASTLMLRSQSSFAGKVLPALRANRSRLQSSASSASPIEFLPRYCANLKSSPLSK